MGAASSKTVRTLPKTAAKEATRRYPPQTAKATARMKAPPRPEAVAQAPQQETADPALAARLQSLGPVEPNPTFSPSPTSTPSNSPHQPSHPPIFPSPTLTNPAVSLLTARYRLAAEADAEFARIGKSSAEGRQFLDVLTVRQVLVMREQGRGDGEIERVLGLRRGVVDRLGARGVVGVSGGGD